METPPPKVHEHLLRLPHGGEEEGVVQCGACGGEPSGQMYHCDPCKFYFHENCANLPLEIKTFCHPFALSLCESWIPFLCYYCRKVRRKVFQYHCGTCYFTMDVECARKALALMAACEGEREREQILHCCHPHPLQPLSSETQTDLPCQICNMLCSSPPTWGCQLCNFHIHKSCLDFLPETIEAELHSGVTSWVLQANRYQQSCSNCGKTIDSHLFFQEHGKQPINFAMLCINCSLVCQMIAESHFQVPRDINHFFHPCPLTLVFSAPSTCSACLQNHNNFSYHCNRCDFFLNFDCIQLPIVSHEEETKIQHFCHWHPLKYLKDPIDGKTFCKLCDSLCSESFYGCAKCHFYIHKSCLNILPQKPIHPLLNQTIISVSTISYDCTNCNRVCSGLTFCCIESRQKFCIRCISLVENEFSDSGRFKSIHHWHQLTSGYIDQAYCFLCEFHFSGPSYHCKECNIFFHKSCAELTRQLQHPTHPHHHLSLTFGLEAQCTLCNKKHFQNFRNYHGFYSCKECSFQLDIRCASSLPSIEYQGHPHLLYVLEILYYRRKCKQCSYSCKGTPVLRCAECDFNLHLLCGPLPFTIRHACHVHSLVVQDYYIEDNATDEFACHICENDRDPKQRIYRCVKDCPMICELKCVLPEVVALLRGEYGEMELDTIYPKIACKVITRDLVLKEMTSANEREKDQNVRINKDVFPLFEHLKLLENFDFGKEAFYLGLTEEEVDEVSYSYSRKAFKSFSRLLDVGYSDDAPYDHLYEQHDGSRMTGDYLLPEVLNSVYEDFFGKYDIFSTCQHDDYCWKRCIVFFICSILHDMRRTKVVDVQAKRILKWLKFLDDVEDIGGGELKLDFLKKHIKRIGRAHFIVQAKKIVDEKSSNLSKQIERLYVRKKKLTKELEKIEMELQERKKEMEGHRAYRATGANELRREYYDALDIKWRWCYEFSVDYSRKA